MTAASSVYEFELSPAAEDIDELEHVSNQVYLRWVLEAATEHSNSVGYDFATYKRLGTVFVVRRHEIDYLRSALLGDRVRVRTWIDSWKAASSIRLTEIVRVDENQDGEPSEVPLARARTVWALISLDSGRPQRIPPELAARFAEK
ncbi:acyl-CoA thioesterase [Haliangium ochraceum]|uniref:Thioesterase superfamily protein n=1 Tax=Haliangium ochraceum (strain DSM 14365 / JCM 11303 / SMP-2) TaxID=502025 RepID=D0LN47_HALO1|nr:thioesterase family protein [Haliangium ochraceum]ACY15224.1 thioesterase superfamily protein [Haliangium ochraceum DSM 14365]